MKYLITLCVGATALVAAPATISLTPKTGQVRASEKLNFAAQVVGASAQAIDWKVTWPGLAGRGEIGSITSAGVYTAPAAAPMPNTISIQAISHADATVMSQAIVTILSPAAVTPVLTKLTPTQVNTGLAYTVAITGTGFVSTSQVLIDNKAVSGAKLLSPTSMELTGTSTASAGSKLNITVMDSSAGAKASNAVALTVDPPIAVVVTPDKRTVRAGDTLAFSARVSNNSNTAVIWEVDGKTGGDAASGKIDATGLYTAPAVIPAVAALTVTAVSVVDPTKTASVALNLDNALPVLTSFSPKTLSPGAVTLTVNGTGFALGAAIYFDGIAAKTKFVSDKQLTASLEVSLPMGGLAAVKVVNPDPGKGVSAVMAVSVAVAQPKMTYLNAVRFLEMATFGPTPGDIEHLQSIGRDAWLAEQFGTIASVWPDPADSNEGVGRLQDAFFTIALTGKDQLRQRVSLALAEIMVASAVKDTKFDQMVGYQRLLGDEAFSTYRDLLGKMTLNPAMGMFLDMVNNDKANPKKGTAANENYAREVMQLFTLGLVQLDANGTPLPGNLAEYDQNTVTEMAKVFTGWTFATTPGFAGHWTNPEYDFLPMEAYADHHDETAKALNLPVPCSIAAGGSPSSDLNAGLDCIYKQQNVAPFVSYRLIQRLVKGSPSPQYVGRVAAAFTASKGDLKVVVTAILTDEEAGTEGTGKMREPVLQATTLLRELNAAVSNNAATGVSGQSTAMGQTALTPGSVFSYFSPFFRENGMVAPEFQSVNAETDFGRANYVFRAVSNGVSGNIKVDFTNWQDLALIPASLVEAINQALYRGEMTSDEKSAVLQAASISKDPLTSVRDAVYVAAGAPQYQIVK